MTTVTIPSLDADTPEAIDRLFKQAFGKLTPEGAKQPPAAVLGDLREAQRQAHATLVEATKRASARKTPAKPAVEPVKPGAGEFAVQVKSDVHAAHIKHAVGRSARVEAWTLLGKRTDAQAIVDKLAAYKPKESPIYAARLVQATRIAIRHQFPKVTDSARGPAGPLVDGLNVLKANGTVTDWSIAIQIDGTLRWTVESEAISTPEGGTGARDLLAAVTEVLAQQEQEQEAAPAKPKRRSKTAA